MTLDVFKQNENQHTVVRFLEGEKSFRKVLNVKNGFSFQFKNTANGFVGEQDEETLSYPYYLIPLFVVVILTLLVRYKRKIGGNIGV